MENNYYWIGSRQSDCAKDSFLFGSITRFGKDTNTNRSFCNNAFTTNYIKFITIAMEKILERDSQALFLFGNEANAYKIPKHLFDKVDCLNDFATLQAVNNKLFLRSYIEKYANTPFSVVLNFTSASNYDFVKKLFNNIYDTFVLQSPVGDGGIGSHIVHSPDDKIDIASEYVLVTPYISNALPVNIHFAIDCIGVHIFQPSIQIISNKLNYVGSDYILFQLLSNSLQHRIISFTQIIAQQLAKLGCRGLMGIDILVQENNLLFLECNLRYQGSTRLLNKTLTEAGYPSVFQIQHDCFYNNINYLPKDTFTIPVNYSSFRRNKSNLQVTLPKPLIICDHTECDFASPDGYLQYEIYDQSIYLHAEKQLMQNPYLYDYLHFQ